MPRTNTGPTIKDMSFVSLSSNFAAATTTLTAVTGLTCNVMCDPGDVLFANISALWNSEGVVGQLDPWAMTSGGSTISTLSPGAAPIQWYGYQSVIRAINIPYYFSPTVAQVDGGRLYVQMYMFNNIASTKTLIANAGSKMKLQLVNLGPVVGGRGRAKGGIISANDIRVAFGGGGTLSVTWTSYASSGMELTLDCCEPGDLVLVGLGYLWWNEAPSGYCDIVTRVAGADVNYVSGLTSTDFGLAGWGGFQIVNDCGGAWPYIVQSGDIDKGSVTFRHVAKASASFKQLVGTGHLWAINFGQVAL